MTKKEILNTLIPGIQNSNNLRIVSPKISGFILNPETKQPLNKAVIDTQSTWVSRLHSMM